MLLQVSIHVFYNGFTQSSVSDTLEMIKPEDFYARASQILQDYAEEIYKVEIISTDFKIKFTLSK